MADEIVELERELKVRENVYPEWSKGPSPRLKPATAEHRLDCLRATIKRLKSLQPPKSEQGSLF